MKAKLSVVIAFAIFTSVFVISYSMAQSSPEKLKGNDLTAYNDMRAQKKPVIVVGDQKATDDNRRILTQQAKYMVSLLLDPKRISSDDWARIIQDAIRVDLPIRDYRPLKMTEAYLEFGREMGNILVKELEPAIKSQKIVVRVNAARLLSVVGLLGCAKSAELALKVLEDPQESEGVKFWCLQTLTNAFMFEPDAAVPEQSIFQVKDGNKKDERELERKCIVYLCNYVMPSRDVNNKSAEEIAAIKYVRREAVRALGHVRTHRLRFEGKVLAHPGLVLLKVANMDGIVPEPTTKERIEAVVGFCQLFPVTRTNVDRDIQCDYAAAMLGGAIYHIVGENEGIDKTTAPWKQTAQRFDYGLNMWSRNISDLKLTGADEGKKLHAQAKAQLLDALGSNQPGANMNRQAFLVWLQGNPPKATALYQDEASTTTVKPAAP